MGLAASQARLLSLTARIHDVEYQAQMIQSAKLQLALQEDEVYRKYNEALDATTLTFKQTDGSLVKAAFNNLCGSGSIKNGMAGDKNYIFRDGSGLVIVPTDIYDGYAKFGGGDAYAFAMYMMTGQDDNLKAVYSKKMQEYFRKNDDNGSEQIKSLRESIKNQIESIQKYAKDKPEGTEGLATFINALQSDVLSGNWNDVLGHFATANGVDSKKWDIPEDLEEPLKTLKESVEKYQFLMFRGGGAEAIYSDLVTDDFDQDKFNYYLRWAKLMEYEGASVDGDNIHGVTRAGAYNSGDIENDPELLNEMLQSGRITVDMIYVDRSSGKISDDATSAASDSNIAYTNTSQIDSKALKKAEAEYEHAMKQIDKKDKRFDMDLNRLETERTALTTEYDFVKQVIKDNIERTFGIFS